MELFFSNPKIGGGGEGGKGRVYRYNKFPKKYVTC